MRIKSAGLQPQPAHTHTHTDTRAIKQIVSNRAIRFQYIGLPRSSVTEKDIRNRAHFVIK